MADCGFDFIDNNRPVNLAVWLVVFYLGNFCSLRTGVTYSIVVALP